MPIETKTLVESFDLPMNFIIEFEFQITNPNYIGEEQIIFEGRGKFSDYATSIYF